MMATTRPRPLVAGNWKMNGLRSAVAEIDAILDGLAKAVAEHEPDIVVLAGFMKLVGPAFLERFGGRCVNTHPALSPAFPGMHGPADALAYGVKVTGATLFVVDEGVDTGPILLQQAIELPYAPDIARVEREIHAVEHRLLPEAVRLLARGAIRLEEPNPGARRRVLIDAEPRMRRRGGSTP
jgi:phosphoribosylglycinamide formyltransferase-1